MSIRWRDKETAVANVPSDWLVVELGGLLKTKYGKSLQSSLRRDSGRYSVVGSAGTMAYTDEPLALGPTLVVGRKGTIGNVQHFPDGVWPIDTVYFFEIPETTDARYLYFNLVSQELKRLDSSTSTPSLRRQDLEATLIELPPIEEQRRIVEILDEQLSRLDAALESVRVVREKAAQFRRSLLHAAFSGELMDATRSRWEMVRLVNVAQLSLGKMLDRKQQTGLHPTPYLRNVNVRWQSIDTTDVQVMDVTPEQFDRVSLQAGDVVVCEGGEPGRSAVYRSNDSFAIQKALHRVRPDSSVDADFLSLFLEHEFRGEGEHPLFTGTTIKHLPKEKLATVLIPIPDIETQTRVVRVIASASERSETSMQTCDEIEATCADLRRSLLHAAFTGELTASWRNSR